MKVTSVPVTRTLLVRVRPWNLPPCLAEMAYDQRLMLYRIDSVDVADRLAAKPDSLPELAELFYFHNERQESEQRSAKRALGLANSGLIFQEPSS